MIIDFTDGLGSHDAELAENVLLEDRPTSTPDAVGDIRGVSFNYITAAAVNKPPGTDHGLMTLSFGAHWKYQVAYDWRTNKAYARSLDGADWTTWAEILMASGTLGLGRLESDASGNITSQGPGNVRVVQSQATFILNTAKINIPGLSVTLTGSVAKPVTYKIEANVRTDSVVTQQVVVLQLFNATTGLVLPDTEVLSRFDIGLTFTALQTTTGLGDFITVTEPTTITVQGSSDLGTGASLNDGNGRSYLMAHRI